MRTAFDLISGKRSIYRSSYFEHLNDKSSPVDTIGRSFYAYSVPGIILCVSFSCASSAAMDKFLCTLPTKKRKAAPSTTVQLPLTASKKHSKCDNEASSQMYLDFGQRSFGATKTCAQCGMHYLIGDVDDEKRHSNFCRSKATIATCVSVQHVSVLRNLRTLMRYSEGTAEEGMVVEVRPQQRANGQYPFINDLLGVVSLELGTSADFLDGSESLLLYFQGRKLIGCLVVESVSWGSLVQLAAGKTATDVMQATSGDDKENCCGNSSNQLQQQENGGRRTLGVKLVWVNEAHRRKSVAARLLDAARRSFAFGSIVKKIDVAFSQPTSGGLAFALAYTMGASIWAY